MALTKQERLEKIEAAAVAWDRARKARLAGCVAGDPYPDACDALADAVNAKFERFVHDNGCIRDTTNSSLYVTYADLTRLLNALAREE